MKTLILAIILAAATAQAADVAYINNQSGGKIVFTDIACTNGGKIVVSSLASGKTISGCWYYTKPEEYIRVIWNDGELYQYPISSVTLYKQPTTY